MRPKLYKAGTDSAGGAHDGVHVLVVSSAVQSADQLVQAAADGVLTVLIRRNRCPG